MKLYKEYIVSSVPYIPDLISGVLWNLKLTGINEEEDKLRVYSEIESNIGLYDIKSELGKLKGENLITDYSVEENIIEEKNWNKEWEKKINVIEVSDKIIIRPSFREYHSKPGQIIITIDPKMSFGTGEHQTTKLMLVALEKYLKPQMKVLDVGTGTGILAIAAAKLGAKFVLGIDNDKLCYENGSENVKVNGVSDKVEIVLGETYQIDEKNFDLVLANINKSTLKEIAQELKDKTSRNGLLILSGLLRKDKKEITEKFSLMKFDSAEVLEMDEWIALVMRLTG